MSLTGEDVKRIRKSLGLNQTDFGARLNVSLRTVQNWESSDKEINHIKAKEIRNLYENDSKPSNLNFHRKLLRFIIGF